MLQMIHNIPQPTFEQFLSDYLAGDENVDLRKGVSFVSLAQVSHIRSLDSTVRELRTFSLMIMLPQRSKNEQQATNSKYCQGT